SMRGRGLGDATARSLVEIGGGAGRAGLTHVRMEQQVGGLTVYGSSVKSTFNARGELVHLIEQVVPVGAAAPKAAAIGERQALDAAMGRVHPQARIAFSAGARAGKAVRFNGGAFFHEAPEVTRVLVPQADGSLAEGFLVQTWTQRGNLLDHTLVGGDGAVLSVERRTATDSYHVFLKDPGQGPQTTVQGPAAGASQPSPNGWLLAGTQNTIKINGNNVSAYLDAASNNKADSGGTSVSTGTFTTAANLTQSPSTVGNRNVAVQNLFYLNNVIHDVLYGHGFTEAAGNFQINNFGKGGSGNDPVNAEAQDGSGTDNANFATPADGSRPRMQMFLWTGAGETHQVLAGGVTRPAMGAQFGPALTATGLNGSLARATGSTNGCAAVGGVSGKIAIVDRGDCDFITKVANAQSAGTTGVIVANNAATAIFTMGGTSRARIPSVMVSQADGATLKGIAGSAATLRLKTPQPLQRDADLDSDIVYHEYGHGLTWRMIGSMSGPLAGAIGEGAADVTAFMVNGSDVVGAYSASNPSGIRRARYAGYSRTYADVTGAEVHDDGEIYAAAMWRLRELWLAERSNDTLFTAFVDGMNYTPPKPAFENMRDGMLDSIFATRTVIGDAEAAARCALVWQAFAQFGIGVGAKGVQTSTTTVTITPSNTARTDCTN
ncbi:MAG TPA: M36 family metallopeptidase, partial [Burkholderiaceae bacterium]